jgi:Integrase zinc binding domain/RNase H-like domain found in reverse transcriptase
VQSFERLDYLLMGKTTELHTDHRNLVYIFDPYGQNPTTARHVASKLMRWALRLCAFRYVIHHVPGGANVWADLLTRWAVRSAQKLSRPTISLFLLTPVAGADELEPEAWPSRARIIEAQKRFKHDIPEGMRMTDGIAVAVDDRTWIPPDATALKLGVLIAAHMGPAGHRGPDATRRMVQRHFVWAGARREIEAFRSSCLQCLSAGGARVRRPLGHAMHAERPNQIIHFDNCYIGPANENITYVLILKDDLSSWTRLVPCKTADALTTANALVHWFAEFDTVLNWVRDQGSHFKNKVIKELRQLTRGQHHFTLPYTPWSNGTVEVVCRELLRCLKVLRLEFKRPFTAWPSLLPMVQSGLNNTILPRLGNLSSTEVFLGLPTSSPLTTLVRQGAEKSLVLHMSELRARQLLQIVQLQTAVENMHKQVHALASKARSARVALHNARSGVRPVNFAVGDYVLRGVLTRERGRKTDVCW